MEGKAKYTAYAFDNSSDSGRCTGELTIDSSQIRFESAGNRISFPITGSQIKLGGASDRLVFFSHPSCPEWTIHTPDRKVLSHPALTEHDGAGQLVRHARGKRILNWSLLVAVLILAVAAPASLVVFMDPVSGAIAQQLPPEWERQLGSSILEQYRSEETLIETPEVEAQLQALAEPLLKEIEGDQYDIELYIAKDENVNAFALPGGFIIINSGLVISASHADELLGVVAHEIAHVTEQHGVRGIIQTVGIYSLAQALFGDASGIMATLKSATPLLINQSYSRSFETEADELGIELLLAARINPDGLYRFFERLRQEEQKLLEIAGSQRAMELLEKSFGLLSSHPTTRERLAHMQSRSKPSGINYINLEDEFTTLKQTVNTILNEQDEDGMKS